MNQCSIYVAMILCLSAVNLELNTKFRIKLVTQMSNERRITMFFFVFCLTDGMLIGE